MPSREHAYRSWDPRRAVGRVSASVGAGTLAGVLMPHSLSWPVRLVAAWDAGGVVLITLAWLIIARRNATSTRRVAAAVDPGRTAVWTLVLASSAVSFFAAAVLLREAKNLVGERDLLVALCSFTVLEAWVVTHTAYTLRYAHLYYRIDAEGVGGLEFPGGQPPDYFDFAYFAFTVGMCFQASDITVSSRQIRRSVLGHALLSFAYNTVILALALNLVFGAFG